MSPESETTLGRGYQRGIALLSDWLLSTFVRELVNIPNWLSESERESSQPVEMVTRTGLDENAVERGVPALSSYADVRKVGIRPLIYSLSYRNVRSVVLED